MSVRILRRLILLGLIGACVYWFATHTYWADEVVPRTARGEALTNPFYSAERLARELGAHAAYDRLWSLPPRDAVVVTAFWDWNRSSAHRAQLESWVESGGRLVTDLSFLSHSDVFSRWSGITRHSVKEEAVQHLKSTPDGCRDGEESGVSLWPAAATPRRYQLCGLYFRSFLASSRPPVWKLTDAYGIQALRVEVGRGSVTVVNGEPFTYAQLLKGTHPALFVAATQLHSGDEVRFFSDQNHASLLALTWQFGAPVVVLLVGALALALWRAAPRFGPTIAPPESARRSLAEQIRGSGEFLLRIGDGQALHGATLRALLAAATRHLNAFSSLSSEQRISRLAQATGYSPDALAAAVNYTGARRANELRSAIALLEAARREILRSDNRSTNGN